MAAVTRFPLLALVLGLALVVAACAAPAVQPTPAGTQTTPPSASVSGQPTLRTPGPFDIGMGPINTTEIATVVFVVDGDTIRVQMANDEFNEYAVRYIGIDAPEREVEPLWEEASEANAELIEGREVFMEPDISASDQHGRLLRHVWLPTDEGWLNIGAEIVRLGLADAKTYEPDTLWDAEYATAESEARAADLGIWSLD